MVVRQLCHTTYSVSSADDDDDDDDTTPTKCVGILEKYP